MFHVEHSRNLNRLVRRDEADANAATGDPHALWYRFDGRQMGSATNDARGSGGDYAGSVDDRQAVEGTGAFRLGAGGGVYDSGFAQGPAAIDSTTTGSEAGSYTVRGGDTLAGIAAQLWGDAGLWYKLADANGLGAGTSLAAGQTLRLPAGVLRSAHSDATLTPYDHAAAIGDIQPTTPQPPAPRASHSKKHCGGFGTVLLAVVAVAVTAIVIGPASAGLTSFFAGPTATAAAAASGVAIGGAAATAGAIAGGAVAGIAASVASQAVGVATGIQDKFSWKGVALAGISGGVGGGLGSVSGLGSGFAGGVVRGALGSAATQGIAVATGLQGKFDWAGVAIAGVVHGVGAWAGARLPGAARYDAESGLTRPPTIGNQAMSGTAAAIAGAAARSLIDGSSFGDNVLATLPDVIGSTVGQALVAGVRGGWGAAERAPASQPVFASLGGGLPGLMLGAPALVPAGDPLPEGWGPNIVITAQRRNWLEKARDTFINIMTTPIVEFQPDMLTRIANALTNASDIGMRFVNTQRAAYARYSENLSRTDMTPGMRIALRAADVAAGGLSSLAGGVAGAPGLLAHPMKRGLVPIARTIDAVLVNESTPARVVVPGALAALSATSPTRLAMGVGSGAVAVASVLAPAARAGTVARFGEAGVAGGRTVPGGVTEFPAGSFSVSDWSGYPASVPRPQGPLRVLEGMEYKAARRAADSANDAIRLEQGLRGQPFDVHEVLPVKFGGSPTDPTNKIILSRDVHRQQVTPWWNALQRDLGY